MYEQKEIDKLIAELIPGKKLLDKEYSIEPIDHGGSVRKFYRLKGQNLNLVLMVHRGNSEEFKYYIEINRFLTNSGMSVPEIISADTDRMVLIMEDLGDVHLEDKLLNAREDEINVLYNRAIDILIRLQTNVTEKMVQEGFLNNRIFSKDKLLAESKYFLEEFIKGYCGLNPPANVADEMEFLADIISRGSYVFMHRDFQSRNIMIKEDRFYLVDFQSSHRGPAEYDLASLLKDAYYPIDKKRRKAILDNFYTTVKKKRKIEAGSFEEFYWRFALTGIQRNMQALGAFAKLGSRMGKVKFLESIPPALKLLEEGLEEIGKLRSLRELVESVKEKLSV